MSTRENVMMDTLWELCEGGVVDGIFDYEGGINTEYQIVMFRSMYTQFVYYMYKYVCLSVSLYIILYILYILLLNVRGRIWQKVRSIRD